MAGPILYLEMLLGFRRGKQHAFRWIYGGWLLLLLVGAAFAYLIHLVKFPWPPEAPFGEGFLGLLLVQHFFVLVLATPAYVAGATTDEKTQGTLQYLLTSDLSEAEIIVGKFLGRSYQVALLAATAVPAIAFCGVFGGLDPFRAFALMCYSALVLWAIGSASVLASVLTRTTREAVLTLYSFGLGLIVLHAVLPYLTWVPGSGLLLAFLDNYVKAYLSPFYIPDRIFRITTLAVLAQEMLKAVLVWGTFGAVCLGLSTLLLRRTYLRQLEGEGKKRAERWWRARRTEVPDDPIRWKERQVEGVAPFAFLRRIPTLLGLAGVFLLTAAVSIVIIEMNMPTGTNLLTLLQAAFTLDFRKALEVVQAITPAGEAFQAQAMGVMLLASFVVAIRCSGAVSGEREKHTWEALLLTPLETRQLIRGKLWGIIGASNPYLLAYAVPALALSLLGGVMAFVWTLIWLGTTWLAMYYVGAAGIWCSTKSKSSWRSLVGTLGFCYVGGFFLYGPIMVMMFIVAFFIMVLLLILDALLRQLLAPFGMSASTAAGGAAFFANYWNAYFFGMCLALAGLFFGLATFFLHDAEKQVGAMERTRHWDHDPDRPRGSVRPQQPARAPAQPQYRS